MFRKALFVFIVILLMPLSREVRNEKRRQNYAIQKARKAAKEKAILAEKEQTATKKAAADSFAREWEKRRNNSKKAQQSRRKRARAEVRAQ